MPTLPLRLRPIVCFCLMALPALARGQTAPGALPAGGTVASGRVTLQQNAGTLRVDQASDKAIVNWQSFNIGRDAAVQFVQPGARSAILNRVASGPSDIAGRLSSNGQVYLVNPNGVLFGASARVDVGSLVVAAGAVSDSSFLSGAPQVASRGAVGNAGILRTADGGSVVLAGSSVANSGSIEAPHGAITLAAGDTVRINLSGDGLIQAQVTLAAPDALAANSGTLASEGGHIALAASGSEGGAGGLVIESGIVRAGAVRTHGGTVSLVGGEVRASGSIDVGSGEGAAGEVRIFGGLQAGTVQFDGIIDARGATAGGMVETSAARVRAGPGARVATLAGNGRHGTWLIDPQDYTIGDAAGDDISGAALSANLDQGNVTIESVRGARSGAGDIFVKAPISWSAGTTLTLTAENGIQFASGAITDPANPNGAALANLTAGGDGAGLAMNFKTGYNLGENKLTLDGLAPKVTINGVAFTAINNRTPESLDSTARANLDGNYVLTSDIDASATRLMHDGLGWEPLGNDEVPFSGQLHGFGHVIRNLAINRPEENGVGLVGVLTGTVRDLGLFDPVIVGRRAGTIAGVIRRQDDRTLLSHSYVAGGSVSGNWSGGLVGAVDLRDLQRTEPVIDSSYVSGLAVSNETYSAPLVGQQYEFYSSTNIRNSFYNAGDPVHSGRPLNTGALFDAQFRAWLAGGRGLRIADYAASLPYDAQTGSHVLSTVQGMRDLLGFATSGIKVRLGSDLDLAGAPNLYIPAFNGEFDGAGHTIANLVVESGDRLLVAGLFGMNAGTIKNLDLTNVRVSGVDVGGLAGENIGTIQNTSVAGTVTGVFAGGIVGFQSSSSAVLADSHSTASVNGEILSGGLAGEFYIGSIRNSYYNADAVLIDGAISAPTIGGLRSAQYNAWLAGGRRLDIASYGAVLPRDPASGAYLVSDPAGMNAMLGFLDDPSLTFRLNADIDLAQDPGLFLPQLRGTLDGNGHRISNLNVTAPKGQSVGLVGINFGTVRNLSVSNVSLEGATDVGGLVGTNFTGGIVEVASSSGSVKATRGSAGGLVGRNFSDISNSYSSADVLPAENSFGAGGLAGENYGSISNSLATGTVGATGRTTDRGGLVGSGSGTVANSFWNTETSGIATSAGGTGKTSAELRLADTYTGWDFTTTWVMTENTPALRTVAAGPPPVVPPPVEPPVVEPPPVQPPVVEPPPAPPPPPPSPADEPVPTQSLTQPPATLALPRVPDAPGGGSVALSASVANGATPQRKELFLQAGDAITRNPAIGTLKECSEGEPGDCIAKPRTRFQAQVVEDTGAVGPAMRIRRKLALVIGNNDYRSPLARLEGAGRDAEAVAAALRQQGYQVDHLADADRSSMIASLNHLVRTAEPDDSVIVFYAGHGYIHPGSSVGYWIPTSGAVDDPRGWLSNVDIARFLANIPARQQLLVSDSCFSGALTREGVAAEQRTDLNRNAILMRRSVVALSSGGEEVVADSTLDGHSPFTYYLLRQLEETKGEIPARDMLLAIRDKVTRNAGQVPNYGIIISSGHANGGEYLLNPKTDQ